MVLPAYLRLLIFLLAVLIPACESSSPAFHMMYSACKLNKQGDSIQPWHTFPIWNQSFVPCLVLTVASWPVYRFCRRQVRWSLPISLRIFHSLLWFTQSKAWHSQWSRSRCFSGIPLLSPWSSECWQFDLWFLCLFSIHHEYLQVHGSHTVEAWLGRFWALLC